MPELGASCTMLLKFYSYSLAVLRQSEVNVTKAVKTSIADNVKKDPAKVRGGCFMGQ